jgi:hypothetical protein
MTMGPQHYVMLLLGLGGLVAGWMAWTGRWRSAGKDLLHPNWSFTLNPALGVLLVGMGLEPLVGRAIYWPTLPVFFIGFLLFWWQPSWFGPRWWRERDKTDLGLEHGPNATLMYFMKPGLGEHGSVETVEREMAPERPSAKFRVCLVDERYGRPSAAQRPGIVEGFLLVYERGLVFAARPIEDKFRDQPTILKLPASAILGVRRIGRGEDADGVVRWRDAKTRMMPRVRIETRDGPWVLEVRRAGRLIAEIRKRYGMAKSPVAAPTA